MSQFRDITYYYREVGKCLLRGYLPHEVMSAYGEIHNEFKGYLEFSEYMHKGDLIRRKTLNLAKVVSSYIRKNMYSEPPELLIEKKEKDQEFINGILRTTNFKVREKNSFEIRLNVGDRIIKPYISNNKIKIQYIPGDLFFETKVVDDEPVSGVFITFKTVEEKGKKWIYTRLEWHYEMAEEVEPGTENPPIGRKIKKEIYKTRDIKNHFAMRCGANDLYRIFGDPVGTEEEEFPGMEIPTFIFDKNPELNNKDYYSSRGIGISVNAMSAIMSADESYEGKSKDIVWGGIQKLVPEAASEEFQDSDGSFRRHHNPNDPSIFVYASNDLTESKPDAYAPELRTESQIASLNTDLDVVSVEVGISAGTLRFDGKSVITATQVITEKSDTARTIQELEDSSGETFKKMLLLIKELANNKLSAGLTYEYKDIEVMWHDNVIVDDAEERKEDLEKIDKGIMSRTDFLVKHEAMQPEKAKKQVLDAAKEEVEIQAITFASDFDLNESNPDGTDIEEDPDVEDNEEIEENE